MQFSDVVLDLTPPCTTHTLGDNHRYISLWNKDQLTMTQYGYAL